MCPISLVGRTFGQWTVVASAEKRGALRCWHAVCACGTRSEVYGASLLRGASLSCGCLRSAASAVRMRTHGQTGTTAYATYASMLARCENPNARAFARYGGRGITVCARWRDFAVFLADMGPKPSPSHSIDRIDNDRGYEPGNCRWATKKEQARNTRANLLIEIDGVTRCAAEWQEIAGIPQQTLNNRYRRGVRGRALLVPRLPEKPPLRGSANHLAKLTEESAREIRAARGGGATQRQVGDRFGVSQSVVSSIWLGKTWTHV